MRALGRRGSLFKGLVMSYFMKLSAKEITFFLFQVAELRVMGNDWDAIAAKLKHPLKEMREFLWEHDAELALRIRQARRDHREFCVDEAVKKLRQTLNSSNEKLSHSAATQILRLRMVELRHRENLRKAKLKLAQAAQKKSPPKPLQNDPPKTAPTIRTLPKPTITANTTTNIDFTHLPTNIQQQTAELAKRLKV